MIDTIGRVIAVLNHFEHADSVLKKALSLASSQKVLLEVLYIREIPLFDIPNYFSEDDCIFDKKKVKEKIREKLLSLDNDQEHTILVFEADPVNRVLTQLHKQDHTLIVTAYHDNITEKLVRKSDASVLVIKNDKKNYDKVVMPVRINDDSRRCIDLAKLFFPQSDIKLLFDNHYVILKKDIEKEKEAFKTLQKETNLEGCYLQEHAFTEIDFIQEQSAIEKHLAKFIQNHTFDLTILYTHDREYLFSNSISFNMLKMLETDILLLRSFDK